MIVAAVLSQIRIYAERAAILENLGWIDAFRRGWHVLRGNLGATIVLWLIFLVLGLIIGAIAFAIVLPITLPLGALAGANGPDSTFNSLLLLPICGLGLVGIIVGAIVSSVLNTFTSATWTLAYRQMTGPRAPLAAPSGPVVEG